MFHEVWWELYKNAILGVDRRTLDKFVREAELAILARCEGTSQVSADERTALEDALSALRVVKREQLRSDVPQGYRN
jgi:hypothetical protein